MRQLIEASHFSGNESERIAYLQGCEFVRNIILKKMQELFDDEWLTDGEIIDQLCEFIKK